MQMTQWGKTDSLITGVEQFGFCMHVAGTGPLSCSTYITNLNRKNSYIYIFGMTNLPEKEEVYLRN